MRRSVVFLAFVVVTAALPAQEAEPWAGLQAGATFQNDPDRHVRTSPTLGLMAGTWLTRTWGAEVAVLDTKLKAATGGFSTPETHLQLSGLLSLGSRDGILAPYLRAGCGATTLGAPYSFTQGSTTRLSYHAGLGLRGKLGERSFWGAEASQIRILTQRPFTETVALLSYGFRWGQASGARLGLIIQPRVHPPEAPRDPGGAFDPPPPPAPGPTPPPPPGPQPAPPPLPAPQSPAPPPPAPQSPAPPPPAPQPPAPPPPASQPPAPPPPAPQSPAPRPPSPQPVPPLAPAVEPKPAPSLHESSTEPASAPGGSAPSPAEPTAASAQPAPALAPPAPPPQTPASLRLGPPATNPPPIPPRRPRLPQRPSPSPSLQNPTSCPGRTLPRALRSQSRKPLPSLPSKCLGRRLRPSPIHEPTRRSPPSRLSRGSAPSAPGPFPPRPPPNPGRSRCPLLRRPSPDSACLRGASSCRPLRCPRRSPGRPPRHRRTGRQHRTAT